METAEILAEVQQRIDSLEVQVDHSKVWRGLPSEGSLAVLQELYYLRWFCNGQVGNIFPKGW